jgi:hypothetical protein
MPLPIPTPQRPFSRLCVEVLLTGLTIHGKPGAFGDVLDPTRGCVPQGPYAITDAAGELQATSNHYDFAKRAAVKAWRDRVAAGDGELTFEAVARQEAIKVQIAAHEAAIAALECEVCAIDIECGAGELEQLDRDLAMYDKAVLRHQSAVYRAEEARDRAEDEAEKLGAAA